MSLRSGKLPSLGSEDEFFDHKGKLDGWPEMIFFDRFSSSTAFSIWQPKNARALQQYVAHYHEERNHQGKQNRLLVPLPNRGASGDNGIVRCKERLGGLLKYCERGAASAFGKLPFLRTEEE